MTPIPALLPPARGTRQSSRTFPEPQGGPAAPASSGPMSDTWRHLVPCPGGGRCQWEAAVDFLLILNIFFLIDDLIRFHSFKYHLRANDSRTYGVTLVHKII